MSWFRLDDDGTFHPKVVAAGNAAYGAWCRAGQWCGKHSQTGLIPEEIAHMIGTKKIWICLKSVGLLDDAPAGFYQIHDFNEYNPTAEQVEQKRASRAAAGQQGGKQSGITRRSKSEAIASLKRSNGGEAKTNPVPIPIPIPSQEREEEPLPLSGQGAAVPKGEVGEVWAHYVAGWAEHVGRGSDKGAPVYTGERGKMIAARMKEGHPAADLMRAVDGLWLSEHHMGENDRGTRYTEPEQVFKSAKKVEMFLAKAPRPKVVPVYIPPPPDPVPPTDEDRALMDGYLEILKSKSVSL